MSNQKTFACQVDLEEIHQKTIQNCIKTFNENFMNTYLKENETESLKFMTDLQNSIQNLYNYYKTVNTSSKNEFISQIEKILLNQYNKEMKQVV